ncbi:MAG TPA: phytanoyl-CoA dioxygenase family protein [Thermoanaerobaculia bacterium]|jgi:ectoine hydroxylase-related dioxygenase (phytanoyl-CoA dioxygenase family)|nr:phytanoyl-CoA dioxygenase family protein [Thermoanaerobaculia bacterium]
MLSARQIQDYRRDGVLFPIPVLSDGEVAAFRAAVEELRAVLGEEVRYRISLPHLHFRSAWDLAIHPAVLDVAESLLGPELLIKGSVVLIKPAGDPAFVAWHQDGTYSRLDEDDNVSAWIALADSTEDNGCLRVIPGSHREGLLPHTESADEHHMLARRPQVAAAVDESRAVSVVLRAGEMSLHHSDILHSSQPNRSTTDRVGYVVRFVTPRVSGSTIPVVRARGRAACPHLEILAQPPPADLRTSLALREEFFRHSSAAR